MPKQDDKQSCIIDLSKYLCCWSNMDDGVHTLSEIKPKCPMFLLL